MGDLDLEALRITIEGSGGCGKQRSDHIMMKVRLWVLGDRRGEMWQFVLAVRGRCDVKFFGDLRKQRELSGLC
jgi:hypothetical protein